MSKSALFPCQPVPSLDLPLTDGGRFLLGQPPAEKFDLLVFYRGLHCLICAVIAKSYPARGEYQGAL